MARYDVQPDGQGGWKVSKRAGFWTWAAFVVVLIAAIATHAPLAFAIAGLIALFGILVPLRDRKKDRTRRPRL